MYYRGVVSYDGTDFFGWQVQPDRPTVQGELLASLDAVSCPGRLIGASRTDRGVHAAGQAISVVSRVERAPENLRRGMNAHLPSSVRVLSMERMDGPFDARRDAKGKTYVYTLSKSDSPMATRFAHRPPAWPDCDVLRSLADPLVGRRDMSSLAPSGDSDDPFVTIYSARWEPVGDRLRFTLVGDRFLYKLVRSLVGKMLAVAAGKAAAEEWHDALRGGRTALSFAPPNGLSLHKVHYDDMDDAKTESVN